MLEKFGTDRCCCEEPVVGCIFASDDFDRPDSTDLGANWTEVLGDLQIVSLKLTGTGSAIHATTKPVNKPEGILRGLVVLPATTSRCRFMFNYTDMNNYDYVELYRSTTTVFLSFITRSGGTNNSRYLASASYSPLDPTDTWTACVEFQNLANFVTGSAYTEATYLSKRVDSFNSLNSSSGKAGVYLSNSATLDDWSFGKTMHEDPICQPCLACMTGSVVDDFSTGDVVTGIDTGLWEVALNDGGLIVGGVLELTPPNYQPDGVRRCWRGSNATGDSLLWQFELTDIPSSGSGSGAPYGFLPWIGAMPLAGVGNTPSLWVLGTFSGSWVYTWRCMLADFTFVASGGSAIGTYTPGDIAKIVLTVGASKASCTVQFYINGVLKSTQIGDYSSVNFDADRRFQLQAFAASADIDNFVFVHEQA